MMMAWMFMGGIFCQSKGWNRAKKSFQECNVMVLEDSAIKVAVSHVQISFLTSVQNGGLLLSGASSFI